MTAVLSDWIDKVGIELAPNVSPVNTATGLGLAIVVSKLDASSRNPSKIIDDDLVVRVPQAMTISSTRVLELAETDPELSRWISFDKCTGKALLHRGLLYLWLSSQLPKTSEVSAQRFLWSAYFDALPKDINLPFNYSIKEMQGLNFSSVSLHHMALTKRLEIEKDYERFAKVANSNGVNVTLQQWLLPHQWILSRGLSHPKTGEATIVPIIDLCNHSSHGSHVRYDIDKDGNFELRFTGGRSDPAELLLNYGSRGVSEYVFNYGFIPSDLDDSDFDQIFKVFDPADADVRRILESGIDNGSLSDHDNFERSLSYDLFLELFSEESSQVLLIIQLPQWAEPDEKRRYRFRNDFIMVAAAYDHMELRDVEDGQALFIGGNQVLPDNAFQTIIDYGDTEVISRAKALTARLCDLFRQQVLPVSKEDGLISHLAKYEAELYERYAEANRL